MKDIVNRHILPVPEGASFCLSPHLRVVCGMIKETHVFLIFTVFKANLKVQESYKEKSIKVILMHAKLLVMYRRVSSQKT